MSSLVDKGYIVNLSTGELTNDEVKYEGVWSSISYMYETVRDTLTTMVVKAIKTIYNGIKDLYSIISNIISSLIGFITSITMLSLESMRGISKALNIMNIICQINSLITTLASLFKNCEVKWDAIKATEEVNSIADTLMTNITKHATVQGLRDNSLSPTTWMTLGVTTFIAILFGGLGLTNTVSWSNLITSTKVLDGIKSCSNNINNVAKFLLQDIIGLETQSDYIACKELEELAEEGCKLQMSTVTEILLNPELKYKFDTFTPRIIKVSSKPIPKDVSSRYNTVRQLLINMHKDMKNKQDAISAILATRPRQVTTGLCISGEPGHGKSELGKYISKLVATKLKYPTTIYSLNRRNDSFYEPYAGAAIGSYNEWMARREDDPLLKDLNLIFSSDPMNFEAASLEGKTQPCQLKFAFLTTNLINPDLIKIMNEGAVDATWDRLYHINVHDPQCKSRHAENKHRKPDFSHLNIELVVHKNGNILRYPTTLNQVVERMIGRCAYSEKAHINSLINQENETGETTDQITQKLYERIKHLDDILDQCKPFDNLKDNSWGREFFITRFQGLTGSRKTTNAEIVAKEISALYSLDIQYSRDEQEFKPNEDTPMIYVLDDWIESGNMQKYLEKINKTHPCSIIFICSNTVVSKVSKWENITSGIKNAICDYIGIQIAQPWDCSKLDYPQGVLRRIGLQGFVRTKDNQIFQTSEIYNKTYTFCQNFVIRDAYNNIGNISNITSSIFSAYQQFLNQPSDFTIIRGPPPFIQDPGVSIEVPSQQMLMETMRSSKKAMQAYLGKIQDFKLKIHDRLTGPNSPSQTIVSTWMVVEEPTNDTDVLESLYTRMCVSFNKTFPQESLYVYIKNTNTIYYYNKGLCYIYNPNGIVENSPCVFKDGYIHLKQDSNKDILISPEELLAAKLFNQFDGSLKQVTLNNYRMINQLFTTTKDSDNKEARAFHDIYSLKEVQITRIKSTAALYLEAQFKKSPIFWTGIGLLSVTLVGAGLYTLSKYIFSLMTRDTNESEYKPNVTGQDYNNDSKSKFAKNVIKRLTPNKLQEEYDQSQKKISKAIRRLTPNMKAKLLEYTNEKDKKQLEKDFYDYEYNENFDPNTSAMLVEFLARIETDEFAETPDITADAIKFSDKLNEDEIIKIPIIGKIYSNMLSRKDMLKVPQTQIEQFHKEITKSYVSVHCNGNHCYGLGIKDNIIITVSHMFEKIGVECYISSNGQDYKAQCVKIFRERDIAYVKILDKNWQNLPNIIRRIIPKASLHESKYGYMLRCGPDVQMIGGHIQYYDNFAYPLTTDNPFFKISEKQCLFTAIGCARIRDFIKIGDCGFPLVTKVNNRIVIMGLHNSYNASEKSFFGSLTSEEIINDIASLYQKPNNDTIDNVEPLREVSLVDVDFTGLMPETYVQALENLQPQYNFTEYNDKLHVLGFSKTLNFMSKPKYNHKFVDLEGMKTPILKLPGAFSLDYVKDTTNLPKKKNGVCVPLYNECLKYNKMNKTNINSDIFKHAVEMTKQECQARYGSCRILRQHEVLNGIHGESLAPMDPDTSAGPLVKLLYKVYTKADLFTTVGTEKPIIKLNNSKAGQMVKNHYETFQKNLFENYTPPIILSKDCAKVELIDAQKAIKGKVRLFNEIDLSINMLLRALFGHFVSKIMDNHQDGPIKMGQDPIITSTYIQKLFNQIDGKIVSTDFSGFDKQLPPELIFAFCEIMASCYNKNIKYDMENIMFSIAGMLTYVIHSCEGIIYLVDRGNESGSFVTTALNSVSLMILTNYTVIRKWNACFKFNPSLSEILNEIRVAILGDDRGLKTSELLAITEEELIEDSKDFGLTCTPAKTSSGLDFCSRGFNYDEINHIVFPALKLSSVYSMVRWFADLTESQILSNLNTALFEAAMHNEAEIFDIVLNDALIICKNYNVDISNIKIHSRDIIRRRFISLVRNEPSFDAISLHARRGLEYENRVESILKVHNEQEYKNLENLKNINLFLYLSKILEKLRTSDTTTIMSNPESNPVGAVLELAQIAKINIEHRENLGDYDEDTNSFKSGREFGYYIELGDYFTVSYASNKKEAKKKAFSKFWNDMHETIENMATDNTDVAEKAKTAANNLAKDYMYKCITTHLTLAAKVNESLKKKVTVLLDIKDLESYKPIMVGDIRTLQNLTTGEVCVLSTTSQSFKFKTISSVYIMQPGTFDEGIRITLNLSDNKDNMMSTKDVNIQPTSVTDVQSNPGITTIPCIQNPIPTQILPAQADMSEPTVGALEPLIPKEDLNPTGAPNMLSVGAIGFDIKDLVYSQFIDSDVQYSFSDDTQQGSIIFQIPYDPLSNFVNPYIKQYVGSHERYAGPLMFRITIVGNSTFSGLIGVAWQPRKIKTNVAKISELNKYSYYAENIVLPSNKVLSLHDARKSDFYRETTDTTDIDSRPHLVCYVHMTAVSPLKSGITVRIRIASKLSAGMCDGMSPFQVALPIIPSNIAEKQDGEAYGINIDYTNRLLGLPLYPILVRPLDNTQISSDFYIHMDGTYYKPSTSEYSFNNRNYPQRSKPFLPISYASKGNANNYTIDLYPAQQFAFEWNTEFSKLKSFIVMDFSASNYDIITSSTSYSIKTGYKAPEIFNLIADYAHENQHSSKVVGIDFNRIIQIINTQTHVFEYITLRPRVKTRIHEFFNKQEEKLSVSMDCVKHFLIYTRDGTIEFIQYDQTKDHTNNIRITGGWSTSVIFDDNKNPYPNQIIQIEQKEKRELLPTGWKTISISDELQFTAPSGVNGFQSVDHPSLVPLLHLFDTSIDKTECLQIGISDLDSGRKVLTMRYFKDRRVVVINSPSASRFMTLSRSIDRLFISELAVLKRSNDFPITDPGEFASNVITTYIPSEEFTPNAGAAAAIIGGNIISGIGGGIAQWQDQVHKDKENQKDRDLTKYLQNNQQDWALRLQRNNFDFMGDLGMANWDKYFDFANLQQQNAGYRTEGAVNQTNRAGFGSQFAYKNPRLFTSKGVNTGASMRSNESFSIPRASLKRNIDGKTTTDSPFQRGGYARTPMRLRKGITNPSTPLKRTSTPDQQTPVPSSSSPVALDYLKKIGVPNPKMSLQGTSSSAGDSFV